MNNLDVVLKIFQSAYSNLGFQSPDYILVTDIEKYIYKQLENKPVLKKVAIYYLDNYASFIEIKKEHLLFSKKPDMDYFLDWLQRPSSKQYTFQEILKEIDQSLQYERNWQIRYTAEFIACLRCIRHDYLRNPISFRISSMPAKISHFLDLHPSLFWKDWFIFLEENLNHDNIKEFLEYLGDEKKGFLNRQLFERIQKETEIKKDDIIELFKGDIMQFHKKLEENG